MVSLLAYCSPKTISYNYNIDDQKTGTHQEGIGKDADNFEDTEADAFSIFELDSARYYLKLYSDSIKSITHYKINSEYILAKDVLPEIYEKRDFELNWHQQDNRFDAISCLEKSWMDGLNPDDYHYEELKRLREDILSNVTLDYKELAQFDILLTDGILLYVYHLLRGKVIPHSLDVNWNFSSRSIPQNISKQFVESLKDHSVAEMVYGFRPDASIYNQFIDRLVRYNKIKTEGGWPKVNFSRTIKPDEFDSNLPVLRKRLYATGDLEYAEGFMDSLYDDDLVNGVKKFQSRHGLNPDGIIGKNTVSALNISVDDKIDQIKVNMERSRWILNEIDDHMVVVNIANFKLHYLMDSAMEYETKVMVGSYYNKTPVFKSKMKYLVFNPTWTVPYSIASKEILPKLKKDPNYLQDRNMTLLNSSGKAIDPKSVKWKEVSTNSFPYVIRQEPGPGNALGQVKFIFPNKYAVYLHDTPSKYLFAKEERAFSHGCIRVQNPLDFAQVLLADKGFDQEKIQEILAQKKEKVVNLKKPLDVLLLYWTCGFLSNGDIFFLKDVYERNESIMTELNNNNWKEIFDRYYKEIELSKATP